MSSSALAKKTKLEEHMKKRQQKKESIVKADTPSSSDVSDTNNDDEIGALYSEASKFIDIVLTSFGLNPAGDSEKQAKIGSGKVSTKKIEKFLADVLPVRTYSTSNLHKITSLMHQAFGKVPLKPKESYNILLSSKIMPDVETVNKDEAVFAVSRSFKYIILRKT